MAQRPGEAFTPPLALLSGLAAGDTAMLVSYSPFANFDPAPVAEALTRYPFGCSEQLSSVGAASLFAPDLANNPRRRGALFWGVGKLLDREALDGSFGLWRVGDGEADPWIGAYVTDFLLQARAAGAAGSRTGAPAAGALGAMRAGLQAGWLHLGGLPDGDQRQPAWPERRRRAGQGADRAASRSRAARLCPL